MALTQSDVDIFEVWLKKTPLRSPEKFFAPGTTSRLLAIHIETALRLARSEGYTHGKEQGYDEQRFELSGKRGEPGSPKNEMGM